MKLTMMDDDGVVLNTWNIKESSTENQLIDEAFGSLEEEEDEDTILFLDEANPESKGYNHLCYSIGEQIVHEALIAKMQGKR